MSGRMISGSDPASAVSDSGGEVSSKYGGGLFIGPAMFQRPPRAFWWPICAWWMPVSITSMTAASSAVSHIFTEITSVGGYILVHAAPPLHFPMCWAVRFSVFVVDPMYLFGEPSGPGVHSSAYTTCFPRHLCTRFNASTLINQNIFLVRSSGEGTNDSKGKCSCPVSTSPKLPCPLCSRPKGLSLIHI